MNRQRFLPYQAQAAVAAALIVRHGSADNTCDLATAATDALIGAADSLPKSIGEVVDVHIGEIGEVRLGGTVVRGAALTANAASKAVSTTTTGHRIIGYAESSGVVDDVIRYRVAPGTL